MSGIKIQKTGRNQKLLPSNTRSWLQVKNEASRVHRSSFCRDLFGDDKQMVLRCTDPHIYCKYRCNGVVPSLEAILNFHCYLDCNRAAKTESPVPFLKDRPPVNFLDFAPKVGDKCDYRPSGVSTYFSCTVKGTNKIDKTQFAHIEYAVESGEQREVYIQYPNLNFLPCGKGLIVRTDCKPNTNNPSSSSS